MHECLLCGRDMKTSKSTFGGGCIRNIYPFLEMDMPKKVKLREITLHNNIKRINNIRGLNKEQSIWLTDRYLTYQYLDKLKYGDYSKLKEQVKEDINNINIVNAVEELKTEAKIKLNEAFTLYKREKRFDSNIKQIKKTNLVDEEKIKLLKSGFSFIFNMGRNKNQYENKASKAMQYAFWQTVIEVGGKYKDFDIAADFMQHSLEKNPKDIVITDGKVVDKIIDDAQFKERVKKIIEEYGKDTDEFVYDSVLNKDSPMVFGKDDLYYAIHKADIRVIGDKRDGRWILNIKLQDTYDFKEFKGADKYYSDTNNVFKSIFSSTLYNLAHVSINLGTMKEYGIDIEFTINDLWEIEI